MKNLNKLIFLVLLAFFSSSLTVHTTHAKVVERIIAIVNSEIITQSQLELYKRKISTGGLVDDALLKIVDVKSLLKNPAALVEHLINERILDSEIKKQNLQATFEKVEKEIRRIARNNRITRDKLKLALRQKGVRFSDYQDFIKTSLERRALIEKEVMSKIKISDEDITSYYISKNGANNSQVFEYSVAHILFLNKIGALDKAKMVIGKLQNGEKFEKLASQYSEDPGFSQGGYLGKFKEGEMLKEIQVAVRGLELAQTSEIIKTRAGYHIVKLLRRSLVESPDILKEKQSIRSKLMSSSFKQQLQSWIDIKRSEAFIKINYSL